MSLRNGHQRVPVGLKPHRVDRGVQVVRGTGPWQYGVGGVPGPAPHPGPCCPHTFPLPQRSLCCPPPAPAQPSKGHLRPGAWSVNIEGNALLHCW